MLLTAFSMFLVHNQISLPDGYELLGDRQLQVSVGQIGQGQPSIRGASVNVERTGKVPWEAQILTPTSTRPVKKGDVLFISYRVRSTGNGVARWGMHLSKPESPWHEVGASAESVGAAWKTFASSFISDDTYPAGELHVTFHVGDRAQSLELADVKILDFGPDVDRKSLPHTMIDYAGRAPNAAWRKKAAAMIEKNRKAALTVLVTKNGKPVKGQSVHVQMLRHAYPFGTFTEYTVPQTGPDADHFRATLDSPMFSRVTVPIYWSDWGWENPETLSVYQKTIDWCAAHNIRMKAHNLLWPSYQNSPKRLQGLSDYDLKKGIFKAMDSRLTLLGKTPFEAVDVLNEIRNEHEFADKLGFDIYKQSFDKAKAAWPKARLIYNDYNVFESAAPTGAQADASEQLAKQLLAEHAPVNTLGWQAHFGTDVTPPETVWAMIDRFQKSVGFPIEITEFDVDSYDEAGQADYTRDLMTAWFAHPATCGFTVWGFWEKTMWKPSGAFFRTDWSLKPNGKAFQDLVTKQWWTDVSLKTDAEGKVHLRGFLGDYRLTSGKSATRTSLPKAGALVRLGS